MPAPSATIIPMSWDQYLTVPDSVRGEYIDGALVVSAAPNRAHQEIVANLLILLRTQLGTAAAVLQGWGWKPGDDEFVPDLLAFPPTREMPRFTGTPYLVVEVLSLDRAADTVRKLSKYAAAGLPSYWLVDPDGPTLTVYELEGGQFVEAAVVGAGEMAVLELECGSVRVRPGELLGT